MLLVDRVTSRLTVRLGDPDDQAAWMKMEMEVYENENDNHVA